MVQIPFAQVFFYCINIKSYQLTDTFFFFNSFIYHESRIDSFTSLRERFFTNFKDIIRTQFMKLAFSESDFFLLLYN